MVVHTASPVMFTAVRVMSRMRSMPMISAMPSSGKPTELNTIDSVIRPTDGTPAVPIDASVAVAMTVAYSTGPSCTPNSCAVNTTATPCMMEVPSMLMVAPSGMVNDEMRRSTPIFFSSVSMFNGMVAFDVAVENANIITDTNFFRNFTGLMRANTVSSTMYTTRHCTASASKTPSMYFTMGRNASKPMLANVRASRQNTPMGATYMTMEVIFIMMSLNCSKKRCTTSTLRPMVDRMMPTNSAKKMMASISPEASAWMGFFGMMFKRVSANDTSVFALPDRVEVSEATMLDMSTPRPGLIRLPMLSATVTASAVVHR